jgi:hypothetical protein
MVNGKWKIKNASSSLPTSLSIEQIQKRRRPVGLDGIDPEHGHRLRHLR